MVEMMFEDGETLIVSRNAWDFPSTPLTGGYWCWEEDEKVFRALRLAVDP